MNSNPLKWLFTSSLLVWFAFASSASTRVRGEDEGKRADFERDVAPVLIKNCIRCHIGPNAEGGVDLSNSVSVRGREGMAKKSSDGEPIVVPGKLESSLLWDAIDGEKPRMPKSGPKLSNSEREKIKSWIETGANWPGSLLLSYNVNDWWSLRNLESPELPFTTEKIDAWDGSPWMPSNPIDEFILSKLIEKKLQPSPLADRRTLLRRLSIDLTGMLPTPDELNDYLTDTSPDAYQKVVDRLLASPRYGERWGRHWLDVVHYGDTHGYDKDKLRPNAWPYRDYVIRSLNADKPYRRFVEEQIAGDAVDPQDPECIEALGFLAAGPFDFVGQVEVADQTMEKDRVRNIDRDDMLSTTLSTFTSTTFQCARCHDHKFDPITQRDYYQLQTVFSAVDRAERSYDRTAEVSRIRNDLKRALSAIENRRTGLLAQIDRIGGDRLKEIDSKMGELRQKQSKANFPAAFGYHSQIESSEDVEKWVQVELDQVEPIAKIIVRPAYDDFGNIGSRFGFPLNYTIQLCNDAEGREVLFSRDLAAPSETEQRTLLPDVVDVNVASAKYVRVIAKKLAPRMNDFIFAIAELEVIHPAGNNLARGKKVTAKDSIEAPVRWQASNLTDGLYPVDEKELVDLQLERDRWLKENVSAEILKEERRIVEERNRLQSEIEKLPKQNIVYAAATDFAASGSFKPTRGEPRPIFLLGRGMEQNRLEEVQPKEPSCVESLSGWFSHYELREERERRKALAQWITHSKNPFTWRSIVNRVWHYHFGTGIFDSLNDLGRMGSEPSNLPLLEWLAVEFRDSDQSLKRLHRLIVTSRTYQQSSIDSALNRALDAGNQFYWRANRRRLEAEAVRDNVLFSSGQLRNEMGGPGFYTFGLIDDHSPHYLYEQFNHQDSSSFRRSIYRFIVRSAPDPFMTTLDCADASLLVEKRNETLTALQALAMLNNEFILSMSQSLSQHIEERIRESAGGDMERQKVRMAVESILGRDASKEETELLGELNRDFGLAAVCRALFNSNEFAFVD